MSYQLTATNFVIRLEDNACIPADETNGDYIVYLQWLEEGNTPFPDPGVQPYSWKQALEKRDKALHSSDWTMIPGCTVDQHAWAVYRQILRDIPQTFEGCDPLEIVWPEEPSTAGPNTRKEEDEVPVETPENVLEERAVVEETTEEIVVEERVPIEPFEVVIETEVVKEVIPVVETESLITPEPVEATIDITEEA